MATVVEPFYVDLGRRIAQIRNRAGWTQERLGSRLQPAMTRAAIANIETGKQRVLAKTLVEIADALDVALDEVVPTRGASRPTPPEADLEAELREKLALPPGKLTALHAALTRPGGRSRGR